MSPSSDADLAIVIPVLRRPHRLMRVYDSAKAATPNAHVLFVASTDDGATREALDAHGLDHIIAPWPGGQRGDYARKINLGYRYTTQPLIFTGADDIAFHVDWFDEAASLIDVPEEAITVLKGGILVGPGVVPRIGVVGTKDLCNERTMVGAHSTHSLVARWYADQGGCADQDHVIYHETYFHEYCDDELVQTAMARQAYAHSEAIVEHLHPNRDAANHPRPNEFTVKDDEVYQLGRARSRMSRRIFMHRRSLWGAGVDALTATRRPR